MVQVGSPFLPGLQSQIGGVTAAQQANIQARLAQQAANIEARRVFLAAEAAAAAERAASTGGNGYGNGNGAGPGAIGGFEIPNNFWGFAMLMMGMR